VTEIKFHPNRFCCIFPHSRWFLDVSGYPKNSKLFLINGIAMAAMFFLVRIFVMPQYWWKVCAYIMTEHFTRVIRLVSVVNTNHTHTDGGPFNIGHN